MICWCLLQVSVLTNGSAEGVAKAVLTGNKVIQLVKGPLLDINMPEVSENHHHCSSASSTALSTEKS
jgi:hypothetical protein